MKESFQGQNKWLRVLVLHVPLLLCLVLLLAYRGYASERTIIVLVVLQAGCSIYMLASAHRENEATLQHIDTLTKLVEKDEWEELSTFSEGRLEGLQHALYVALMQTRHHEKSLKQQREYMKEFISHISHQMKTPLAALVMYNELMEDESMSPEARRDFLKRSGQQLERLEWLIQSLLQIAKLEADTIVLERKPVSMDAVVEAVVDSHEIFAQGKDVRLLYEDAHAQPVEMDERWMIQAVENIVKNGVEHTPPGGQVRLWTEENRFTLSLFIEDSGQGMSEEQIDKVFEPFYSRKPDDASVGLGLALAKAIVVKHGGQIFVRSSLGKGTRFEIVLEK